VDLQKEFHHENTKEGEREKDIPEMRTRLKKLGRIGGWWRLLFRVSVLSCFRDWFLCKA
jgi:hypothetical protein